jgi:hypothetical protein
MNLKTTLSLLLAVALAGSASSAAGQDVTAAVRTWSGQSWQLGQPSLEVFYTIVSKAQESSGTSGGSGATGIGQVGGLTNLGLGVLGRQAVDPSLFTLNRLFGSQAPDTIQGHRQAQEITVYRGGVAAQIAVASIATLVFGRQPVQDSSLPPYIADTHVRSTATVLLTDGTRVEADYVNLGGMLLRGTIPGGRMDIPWQDIQTVEFRR